MANSYPLALVSSPAQFADQDVEHQPGKEDIQVQQMNIFMEDDSNEVVFGEADDALDDEYPGMDDEPDLDDLDNDEE